MIDTVEKMKEDGYYLVRHFEDSGLAIEEVSCGQIYRNGEYYSFDSIHIHWIADEPLDLEQLLVNCNSSVDVSNHVKCSSKDKFAREILKMQAMIDSICKLLRYSYIIKQDGNIVFESKSFCESLDKWDTLSERHNWKELLLLRKCRGKEEVLRCIRW